MDPYLVSVYAEKLPVVVQQIVDGIRVDRVELTVLITILLRAIPIDPQLIKGALFGRYFCKFNAWRVFESPCFIVGFKFTVVWLVN